MGGGGVRGAAGSSGGAANGHSASSLGAGGAPPTGSSRLGANGGHASGVPASPGGSTGAHLGAVRAAAYSMGLKGLSDSRTGKRLSKTQILNTFKAELREYRALQEELSTWTAAFREKNGRKPNLVDVQRTGIPWLIERFKQYVVLRDRLFSDTSVLRTKMDQAVPDPESVRNANGGGPSGGMSLGSTGPMNANGPGTGERNGMANRFAAVMDYKMKKQGQAAVGAAAAAAASLAVSPADAAAAAAAEEEDPLAAKILGSSQAPPRVRLAMHAAIEYRQKKAQETKAAAETAAAAARAAGGGAKTAGKSSLRVSSLGALPQGVPQRSRTPVLGAGAPGPARADHEAAQAATMPFRAAARPVRAEATDAAKSAAALPAAAVLSSAASPVSTESAEVPPGGGIVAAART